jgi:hypothetical protein
VSTSQLPILVCNRRARAGAQRAAAAQAHSSHWLAELAAAPLCCRFLRHRRRRLRRLRGSLLVPSVAAVQSLTCLYEALLTRVLIRPVCPLCGRRRRRTSSKSFAMAPRACQIPNAHTRSQCESARLPESHGGGGHSLAGTAGVPPGARALSHDAPLHPRGFGMLKTAGRGSDLPSELAARMPGGPGATCQSTSGWLSGAPCARRPFHVHARVRGAYVGPRGVLRVQ